MSSGDVLTRQSNAPVKPRTSRHREVATRKGGDFACGRVSAGVFHDLSHLTRSLPSKSNYPKGWRHCPPLNHINPGKLAAPSMELPRPNSIQKQFQQSQRQRRRKVMTRKFFFGEMLLGLVLSL